MSSYSIKQNGMKILNGIGVVLKSITLDLDAVESSTKFPEKESWTDSKN